MKNLVKKTVVLVLAIVMVFSFALTASAASGIWKQNSKGWWYSYSTGGYAANKWEKIGSKWYHFDSEGYMQTGWLKDGGKWYYLGKNGAMTTGWKKLSGKWYYMNKSGALQTGWVKYDSKWYYLSPVTYTIQIGWVSYGSKWYYIGPDGAMTTGWQKISGKWYYMGTDGMMTTGWQKISGKWYYMNTSGIMQTGWQTIGGKKYYFMSDGAMAIGTQTIDGKKYTFGSDGVLQEEMESGWSSTYQNFVLNNQYASDSLIYTGSDGLSGGVRFALADINLDGTAELLIDTNFTYFAGWLTVVYTYFDDNVVKAGTAGVLGPAGIASTDSKRPGIFGYNCRMGVGNCMYFTLEGTSIVSESVFTDNAGSVEPYHYTITASDEGLYTAYENGTSIHYYSLSEIKSMGWDVFVQECGF